MINHDLIKMKAGMHDEYFKKYGYPEVFTLSNNQKPLEIRSCQICKGGGLVNEDKEPEICSHCNGVGVIWPEGS